MKRVVIDTGVVVSAAFRDRKPERLILFVANSKDFEWVVSPAILKEYNEVLAREKFGLPGEILDKWRRTFEAFTTIVEPDIRIDFPRDRKDAIFLECSAACEAEYLITGDSDLTEANNFIDSVVISVSQFILTFYAAE